MHNLLFGQKNDCLEKYNFFLADSEMENQGHVFRVLDASTHLYKRLCPSVGPSVRRSVRPSIGPSIGPSVRKVFFSK